VQAAKQGDARRYSGLVATIDSIWRQEGVLGFFSGLRTKVVQSVLSAAIMFLLKEIFYEVSAAGLRVLRPPAPPAPPLLAPRALGSS
jgi:Mitochondrial carrier protein